MQRLSEILELLGESAARPKPCEGMMGLIEEGEDIILENWKRVPHAADLNLIAAARKVEHYEIASYMTARNLANQLGLPEVSRFLQMTLAEEQNADLLLGRPAAII